MNSRISKFHTLLVDERLDKISSMYSDAQQMKTHMKTGGLSIEQADKLVENVIGLYNLPFSIATNFVINGKETLIPMCVEEPSVVAAASHAAKIIRVGSGFHVEATEPLMIVQIQLFTKDPQKSKQIILDNQTSILDEAKNVDPKLSEHGGGPKNVQVREILDEQQNFAFLVIHLIVDVRDAMGANAVNSMAEKIAPSIEALTGGQVGLKILSNLADKRLVKCSCDIPVEALTMSDYAGEHVAVKIEQASRFAELDPYRAATHNKGIMNGVDPVVIATGNDWRAVEAGAHAYAARSGTYKPLCVWRHNKEHLTGELELPIAVGVVGGAVKVHDNAQIALKIMQVSTANDLAQAIAAVGMANNFAALRALATEGIQKGHMRLHNRSR